MMASMRDWLRPGGVERKERVVVVHCKAGKGRSGTSVVSYLMSEEGWSKDEALQRFTERRMRPGFGAGVSIPSQLRYVDYVERWVKGGKVYVEQAVEIVEVHAWGLRDGVKIAIEGYVDEGKKIKTYHVFTKGERDDIDEHGRRKSKFSKSRSPSPGNVLVANAEKAEEAKTNTIFRPSHPLHLPTNDINLAVECRSAAGYGLSMVTAVAHVWFNTFFEGNGPEHYTQITQSVATQNQRPVAKTPLNISPDLSGVFEITWDAMDGIKGSARKGATRAFDKCAVVWRLTPSSTHQRARANSTVIVEPPPGEPISDTTPPDWRGRRKASNSEEVVSLDQGQISTRLGLRPKRAWEDKGSSRASSTGEVGKREIQDVQREGQRAEEEADSDEDGVQGINRGVVDVEEGKGTGGGF